MDRTTFRIAAPASAGMQARGLDHIFNGNGSTRERIAEGALHAFREKGVGAATVEDVLRAAGVSRGTFYQYFRSKDDVAGAVFRYSVELLINQVNEAIVPVDAPFAKIERAVDVYLELQESDGKVIHGLMAESLRPGSPLATLHDWAVDTMVEFLQTAIEQAQQRRVDGLVFRTLIYGIEGVVMHFLSQSTSLGEKREKVREAIISVIERTFALPGDVPPDLPTG